MKLETYLKNAIAALDYKNVPTARLDALVLIGDMLKKDKGWILANLDFPLDEIIVKKLNEQFKRRALHEPLAYIRGKSEFYGREFKVSPATLEPRPESETMIEVLRRITERRKTKGDVLQIIDVGTGSGCLAITAKLEFPKTEVCATEINEAALKIAKQNAKNHEADVKFYQGDLIEPLSKFEILNSKFVALLCNLPYVPDSHTINEAAMHEPKIAIFGGEDGLDLYRRLFLQLSQGKQGKPIVLTESLPFQHETLREIAKQYGYKQASEENFIQVFSKA